MNLQKRIINPWKWQDNYGFVQANEVANAGQTLFTAGIVSVDDEGNLLYPNNMEKQLEKVVKNMTVLLDTAGFSFSDVVKFTYYTTDIKSFAEASYVLSDHFQNTNCKPSTSLIGVNELFHPDCIVEIEAVAVK